MKVIILFVLLQFSSIWEHTDSTKVKQDSTCLDSNYHKLILQLEDQKTKIDSLLILIQKKMEE